MDWGEQQVSQGFLSSLRGSPAAKSTWASLSALLLLLGCAFGCSAEPTEKEPVVSVQAQQVERRTLQHTVTAEALLSPLQQAAITPKVTAPVKRFYVNRGDKVRAGQLLAVLENRDLAAAAAENKGAYEQAEAAYSTTTKASLPQEMQRASLDVEAAKRALAAQQKVYNSRKELFEQGALPRKELDQSGVDLTNAQNQYEIALRHLEALQAIGEKDTLKSASGQLESARGRFEGAEAQLAYSEIRSPIRGVVTDRPLYAGETASAGMPLLTVMDTSRVIAKLHVPQADAALLRLGDAATLTAPGEEEPVQGKVTLISPALDPNSTTVEVWVQAENEKQRLRPGTSVQVTMLAKTLKDTLVVPTESVLTAPDGATTVMVLGTDGRAHQQTVRVGVRQGNAVQILDGLAAGQRVITAGAFGLPDNTQVKVETRTESGPEKPAPGDGETPGAGER
jgi:HlyD family secretion protein